MAKLSITQAAKMAGISRQTLYVKYINTGSISIEVVNNKKVIDTSEIIRVFNDVKILDKLDITELQAVTPKNTQTDKDKIIALLESQLAKSEEREEKLNVQVSELLQQQTRLLELDSKPRKKFLGIF